MCVVLDRGRLDVLPAACAVSAMSTGRSDAHRRRKFRLRAAPALAGSAASCARRAPEPALIVCSDDGAERYSVALRGDRVTIGCDPGDMIFLADLTISPQHAVLRRTARGYVLDQGGPGTGLGSCGAHRRLLAVGDRLKIGRYRVAYRAGGEPPVRHA